MNSFPAVSETPAEPKTKLQFQSPDNLTHKAPNESPVMFRGPSPTSEDFLSLVLSPGHSDLLPLTQGSYLSVA